MVASGSYRPVGRCIYCGARTYGSPFDPARTLLGDEHIVAQTFGGRLKLPESSCWTCEDIISPLEAACARAMVNPARAMLGLRGRRAKRDRGMVAVPYGPSPREQKRLLVPKAEAPAMMLMYEMDPASILLPRGTPRQVDRAAFKHVVPKPVSEELLAIKPHYHFKGFTNLVLRRVLAKTAHSYAVAELGLDGFNPLLPPSIRGLAPPGELFGLVGGAIAEGWTDDGDPSETHLLRLGMTNSKNGSSELLLVVSVQLFATLGMPRYHVVVGLVTDVTMQRLLDPQTPEGI